MKKSIWGAVALSMTLAACGSGATKNSAAAQQATPAAAQSPAAASGAQVYSATGDVTEISGDRVTISHGPVEGIGWPAMTMGFKAGSPEMTRSINVGDPVAFQFKKDGESYTLTSLSKQ